jgi:hypothetical protein
MGKSKYSQAKLLDRDGKNIELNDKKSLKNWWNLTFLTETSSALQEKIPPKLKEVNPGNWML